MTLLKFTPHMISNQPDQTAYLLNKLAEGHGGGGAGTLYDTTGQNTDGAMTQKATTNALGTKADAIAVGQALAGKVDKEAGKELSDNNFTDEELGKLNGIQAGAEVNVQSDWDQMDTSADDYIKNKPTIPTATSDLQNDSGFITIVQTGDIADNAVTSAKIDFTTSGFQYQNGTYNFPMFQAAGRTGNGDNQNKIYFTIPTNKTFPSGATVTFAPENAYGVEVMGPNGVLFSESSNTGDYATVDLAPNDDFWTGLFGTAYIDTSRVTLPNNTTVTIKITGTITIS